MKADKDRDNRWDNSPRIGATDDPRTRCSLCYKLEQGVEEGAEGRKWAGGLGTPFVLSLYNLQVLENFWISFITSKQPKCK